MLKYWVLIPITTATTVTSQTEGDRDKILKEERPREVAIVIIRPKQLPKLCGES
jgi:hypothetical protein